ncbi:hypothetical protein GWI33_012468 [Rhynchophorus ferrugineus]|uniref:Glycoside hydrolase family 31 TIM barrel domain-containing protein n=1 Tax=Rhynchophorus ferrugineus TaxID=354439 RepID=A0A834IBJ4_RHYFE|nr:hypothetical protein GWI33_012468 [Rhynchophorus ferrugineus]
MKHIFYKPFLAYFCGLFNSIVYFYNRKGDETELADILEIYADVSFDSECIHENLYLSLQKGTSSDNDTQNLRSILNNIRSSGTKFVLSLQPHVVAFDNNTLYNESKDIFYKDSSGDIYQGSYLGLPVAYPDYTHKNIKGFAENLIKWIHEKLGEKTISGFVLSENWLQDDSVDEVYNSSFKYYPENINIQMQYTIPWNLSTSDDRHDVHMEIHNSYGSLQYNTLKAVDVSTISATEDISDFFIASASKTFGDNEPEISDNFNTSWDYFKMYLDKILFSSITGDYMVGLPICGDTDTYNKILHESLCIRWYEAAATMPYFRVSSGDPYRDPSNLNTNYSTDLVRKIIERRKMLQDYYYTIITTSLPLVRPLYFDYFNDTATFFLEGCV